MESKTRPTGRLFTVEQELGAITDTWLQVAYSTRPVDRRGAEAAVGLVYRLLGLPRPRQYLWVQNPLAGWVVACAIHRLERTQESVAPLPPRYRHLVALAEKGGPDDELAQAHNALLKSSPSRNARQGSSLRGRYREWVEKGSEMMAEVKRSKGLVETIERNMTEILRPKVRYGLLRQVSVAVRRLLPSALRKRAEQVPPFWGPFAGGWLADDEAVSLLSGIRLPLTMSMAAIAREGALWWGFDDISVLSERPALIATDARQRLHSETGPSMRWPDGWSLHHLHGFSVSASLLETCRTPFKERIPVTADRADWFWAELARHYGMSVFRFFYDTPLVSVADIDVLGKSFLLHAGDPQDRLDGRDLEKSAFVSVLCPSTRKAHFLRVPPHILTVRDGIAWTFGFSDSSQYNPICET